MDQPLCPGCRLRDERIAALEQRVVAFEAVVRELTDRLNTNSKNSSLPPSANPLDAPKPLVKKKSRRKRGGQPGHPPHLKQVLPPERVNHVVSYVPTQCANCATPLPTEAAVTDPPPTRFQTIELPPVVSVVTEHQRHARICPCCGEVTWGVIPRTITDHSVGPRLTATLSYFTGCHGVSKRGVEEIAAAVFDAPVSLGTVANLEQEVSAALAPAHAEALAAVREAEVKSADETSWKLSADLCWLWAAATATVAAFVIHKKRSVVGLTALLGATIRGIVTSDRWGPYTCIPENRRQLCWAHLKRDFQKIVDRGGASMWVGRRGLVLIKKVFAAWHAFREGRSTREQLHVEVGRLANRMNKLLQTVAI